jgi:tRNA(Ile)-lysidine synthetase-like protein
MKPARLKGRSRKLSDLFIDAKVPRAARSSARVLVRTTDGVIVWAEHVGIAFGESLDIAPQAPQTGGSF